MHRVFCIIGKTASGKSTLAKALSEKLGLKILKSYTTRPMRANETLENSDHTFINQGDVEPLRADMVAYTERVGYCSFATATQLLENDIYIINPSGFRDLKKVVKERNIPVQLCPIYLKCEDYQLEARATLRGDNLADWWKNAYNEEEEFTEFEKRYDEITIWNINMDSTISSAAWVIKHYY